MSRAVRHVRGPGRQAPARRTVMLAGVAAVATVAAMVPAAALAAGGGRAHRAPATRPGRHSLAVSGVISTVAGGPGGPALATRVGLRGDCGLAFAAGNLYIADGGSVRKVSRSAGFLTTPAGTGAPGPLGDGRLATRAGFDGDCGVTTDQAGNLVIADSGHQRIRVAAATTGTFYGQAMTAGRIYTVAGNGTGGFSGDGGPATAAEFNGPIGVAVDGPGNLVIADEFNDRVRVVAVTTGTFYGRAMTAGDVYTVAGGGSSLGDGGPATSALLRRPAGVAVDGAGNLLVADSQDNRVRVVAVKAGTFYGHAMIAGDVYTVAGDGSATFGGDGGLGSNAQVNQPLGVAVDGAGNLVIADTQNGRVRVVAGHSGTFYGQAMTVGDIYTVAGNGGSGIGRDGGPATGTSVANPAAVAADDAGNLLVTDDFNRVRLVAASTGSFYGKAATAGDIYTVAGNATSGFSGDNGPAIRAEFNYPARVAVDGAGNLAIADEFNNRVRVVAATTGTFYGKAMTAGDAYTVAGTGKIGHGGDGGPATSAGLYYLGGIAADGAGNLVIADTNNERIRVVAGSTGTFYGKAMTAGDIYTVAGNGFLGFSGDGGRATSAEISIPRGVAVDNAGNLLIADSGNFRIRVVAATNGTFYGQAMTAGDIYTGAGNGAAGFSGDGGRATSAGLNAPEGAGADGAGNLLIADTGNHRIRVVAGGTGTFYGKAMTEGDIYTVAGAGFGFSGDGGPATAAHMVNPTAVVADGAGNLVIAARGNHRVRVVAASTGSFYGVAMTAGDIYTVAGSAINGLSGDGGPATKAGLSDPSGVAIDGDGNLVIADTSDSRIRLVGG
jgi:trimeric autotransporter adhesin